MAKILSIAAFAATASSASLARAETPTITALREGADDLEARANALHRRADRSPPTLRREVERIVAVVDNRRMSIVGRIEIVELIGRTDDHDAPIVDMKATLAAAERLLAIVEHWYGMR